MRHTSLELGTPRAASFCDDLLAALTAWMALRLRRITNTSARIAVASPPDATRTCIKTCGSCTGRAQAANCAGSPPRCASAAPASGAGARRARRWCWWRRLSVSACVWASPLPATCVTDGWTIGRSMLRVRARCSAAAIARGRVASHRVTCAGHADMLRNCGGGVIAFCTTAAA